MDGYSDEPVLLSEFGGIALEDGRQESWGYHDKARDAEALKEKIESILRVVHKLTYLSGYCYTQPTVLKEGAVIFIPYGAKIAAQFFCFSA